MDTYSIIRFFQDGERQELQSGLSLEDAQEHCNDPQTSSRTCTEPALVAMTAERGQWFDGFEAE